MSDWIGRVISKVEIQKLLGRGGMAEVYLGRHTTLNRPVAVKVLQAHLLDDPALLNRFTSEAQAVAAMRHPNIVQVFDFDVVDGRPYIVMELLEGPSLKDHLSTLHTNRRTMPSRTATHLISSLAAALDYAHARGIVHRDVKPANIMLRHESGKIDPNAALPLDAEPVLTDFGVARIADAASQTVSGTIVGTPAYMSPEQIRGERVDARSDIYSLGIILYEMLAGQVPFSGDTQASVLMKHVNEPVPQLPTDYFDLQAVVDRALAKDPSYRFQKASDLASVLQAALGLPTDSGVTEPHLRDIMAAAAAEDEDATMRVGQMTRGDVAPVVGTTAVQPAPPTRGFNPLWAVAGVGALVLAVGLVTLGLGIGRGGGTATQPAETAAAGNGTPGTQVATQELAVATSSRIAPGGKSLGTAVFNDATLTLTLHDLPAPTGGSAYFVWLNDPQAGALNLGELEVKDGKATLTFTASDGTHLLVKYSSIAISEEKTGSSPATPGKVVFAGQLQDDALARLRALDQVAGGAPLKVSLLNGLKTQSDAYNSHLNFAITALGVDDLTKAKTHAEHIINIIVGAKSKDYADWNGNGRIENPGDEVGLIPYLLLVKDAARGASDDPGAAQGAHDAADTIVLAVDSLVQTANDAVRVAKQIVNADQLDAATKLLGDDLSGLEAKNAVAVLRQEADPLNLVITVQIVPAQP